MTTSLLTDVYNNDVATKICHIAFLVWSVWNLLYLGAWFHPEWLQKWAQKNHMHFFNSHGIAVNVVLFCCTGDVWFKWLGGIALVTSLFCLMTEIQAQIKSNPLSYDNLKLLFLLDCHHLGPIIALYYQAPEHAWLNALFFGHVWWIHGKGKFYDPYVKPIVSKFFLAVFDLDTDDNRAHEKGYAVITVLLYSLYLAYFPFGWNYSTAAFLCQFAGRNIINDNYLNVDWMRDIELPGVISVTLWNFGAAPVICAYLMYSLLIHYRTRENGMKLPEKFVMTDEIRKFMAEFPRKVQDDAENEGKATWFDGQGEEWKQYVLFKHCMLGNEEAVKKLLDDGADPEMTHKLWHNSKPLAWAAASDQIGVLCLLIEAGAFPFDPEGKKTAIKFKAEKATKFFDELVPLTYSTLRSEFNICYERVEAPGLTHKMSVELAKEKGARLLTNEEALEFLMGTSLLPKEDQWIATFDDGKPDWVQIGDKIHEPGTQLVRKWGKYPPWGDNLEDKTYGTPTWQRILVWKIDEAKVEESDEAKVEESDEVKVEESV